MAEAANAAINLYLNPLAALPEADALAIGEDPDQVRLAVLAGETALANDLAAQLLDELDEGLAGEG